MKYENPYLEAMRYIDNAREILKNAGREGKFYIDEKYVHTAFGAAYIGVLKALDFLFEIKGLPKAKGRKTIEYYQYQLSKFDKKLLSRLNEAYTLLHLDGYYSGIKNVKAIEGAFEVAVSIIDYLKPYSKKEE
ncbi:MAG: hypothetical protein QG635_153 [Bacteroidota bacterium]|nr:hypothetical protein [Bacteroidota bacterium]